MVPTSGTSGAGSATLAPYDGSGPWMVERQSLKFDYVRVPRGGAYPTYSIGLSSVDIFSTIMYTSLEVRVTASYSKVKDYNFYSTSSFVQPQQFEIIAASGDPSGITYGGASGVSAMGPQGAVITAKEWYFRRPWNSGVDVEYTKAHYNLFNYLAAQGVTNCTYGPSSYVNQEHVWGDFNTAYTTFSLNWDKELVYGLKPMFNEKPGPYSLQQETPTDVWTTVNEVGTAMSNEDYWGEDIHGLGNSLGTSGIDKYDISRHNFS